MDRGPSRLTPSLTRRQLLAATGAAAVLGTATTTSPAVARPRTARTGLTLTFTRATNGSASLAPTGDTLIAEIQSSRGSRRGRGGLAGGGSADAAGRVLRRPLRFFQEHGRRI